MANFSFGASADPRKSMGGILSNAVPGATPTPPPTPIAPPVPNPFQAILSMLMQGGGQQAGPDLGGLLSQIRNDPQGDANKAYIPGTNNSANPFANGFFKTPEQRKQVEINHLGVPGFSSLPINEQQAALRSNQMPDRTGQAAGASPLPFQLSPDTLNLMNRAGGTHVQPPAPTTASNMFGINSPDSMFNVLSNIFRNYKPQTPLY